jgi:hypothetical protein
MRLIKQTIWMCSLLALLAGCSGEDVKQARLDNKPLQLFEVELLDQAFSFATAIPLEPHIKDRARSQEKVVVAALEMDQPNRALDYARQIPNWRQGKASADYACYSIGHGVTNGLAPLLEEADRAGRSAEQDWRRERVWLRVSEAWRAMGRTDKAAAYNRSLKESEAGSASLLQSQLCNEEGFEEYASMLDNQLKVGGLDLTKSALYTYAALYDRLYGEEALRQRIEEKILAGWGELPLFDRFDLLKTLSSSASAHGDMPNASVLADRAGEIVAGAEWPAEYHVQLLATLAKLRLGCGETSAAANYLEEALSVFTDKKGEIVNIYRAEALVPVAEAFARSGDTQQALAIYALAVEEAVENPNARPRAEDLSLVSLSMAQHGIEPDAALWNHMKQIKKGLGDPW